MVDCLVLNDIWLAQKIFCKSFSFSKHISAQFVISKNQKCAWLVSRTDSTVRRRGHNLSMPTIGETSTAGETSAASPTASVPINGNARRPFRTRSCRLPSSSSSTTSRRVLMQPRSRSLGLEGSTLNILFFANIKIHTVPITKSSWSL